MAFGILDDRKLENVPGTAPLSDFISAVPQVGDVDTSTLKHDENGIVLIPQPTDDPNDPYNWPRWKKEMFTVTFAFGCGCVGAVGPLLGPALVQLSEMFDVSLTTWNIGMQGGTIACIAVGSLIFNALAVKYGKRPIYLATTVGLMITCFWAAAANSLTSLIVSRLFMGFCMAPFEALVPASIADVWFVHQRGFRSSIFNLGVLGGINLATPISGNIIQDLGYRASFNIMGAFFAINVLLVIFFMPETAYRREPTSIDLTRQVSLDDFESNPKKDTSVSHIESSEPTTRTNPPTPYSFWSWKELAPYSGYNADIKYSAFFIRPFTMLLSPAVAWGTLLFTTSISWLVGISITLSQIFSAPPYNFSIKAVGACNLSAFVASIIGMAVAGPLIDGIAKKMSKGNRGIFEPEFRLPAMASYLCLTAVGFFAWGQSAYAQDPWPIPVVVCLGMINLGIQLSVTGIVTYVVDCHVDRAGEAFAAMNFVKNMFAFGLVFYLNDWLSKDGVRKVFFSIGGVTAAVSLLTVPMYIFGKRARSWVYRSKVLDRFGADTTMN
ncbi:major facilitator superfamily domain-containing protein [Clohesyomyces aquaticus]|uniref:Major facilitator superfamily domain-containing protein n=1 Tax=Clohesyomyces aquaticus TaxID=1231657 RepID=A0A1Y1ZU52_9PLEO|nr:major facilitator superfamily domain-containing protein [Clohesyomyces aquaticus]